MSPVRELDVIQVDVFTETPFTGNPAAVILNANHLSEETMVKIAREMNVRESVFVSSSNKADFRFRFMTPKAEIPFSGHATIAAFLALQDSGQVELTDDITMKSLETNSGVLYIEIMRNNTTGIHEVQITHDKPEFMDTYDPKDLAEAFGLSLADIHSPNPVQTVSTGTPHLIIPVSTQRSLDRIVPDWKRIEELCESSDFTSISVFTRDVRDETSDAQFRHFAPALGVPEDPVSGSAAGNLGAYIMQYGFMDVTYPVTSIVLEQGHYVGRPGRIFVEVQGDQNGIELVKVSGRGIPVLRGKLQF
jgi:trans-2,3-dihydro-3-hydroxyanthranilate isomerase